MLGVDIVIVEGSVPPLFTSILRPPSVLLKMTLLLSALTDVGVAGSYHAFSPSSPVTCLHIPTAVHPTTPSLVALLFPLLVTASMNSLFCTCSICFLSLSFPPETVVSNFLFLQTQRPSTLIAADTYIA